MTHRFQALLVAAIWGVNFVVIDIGLRDLPPLVLTALRFVVAAVPLVLLVPRPTARLRYVVGYGLVLGVLKFGVLFTAMAAGMPAGLASLVLQAQALVSVLLAAVLLRERPTGWQVAGVLVGSVGIGMLAVGGGGRATLVGFALTLAAAVSWAVANVVVRASGETRPLSLLVWSSLVPPIPLLGLASVVDGPGRVLDAITGLSWGGILAVLYVAYVSTLVGFGLWNRLIATYSVARIARSACWCRCSGWPRPGCSWGNGSASPRRSPPGSSLPGWPWCCAGRPVCRCSRPGSPDPGRPSRRCGTAGRVGRGRQLVAGNRNSGGLRLVSGCSSNLNEIRSNAIWSKRDLVETRSGRDEAGSRHAVRDLHRW